MSAAADLVQKLALQPHPEGGWFREIYRSATRVETPRGSRAAVTTIYYLLEQRQLSRWHVVQADEVWHFYGGAPLELLEYAPGVGHAGPGDPAAGKLVRHELGGVSSGASVPVAVIPTGAWQAASSRGEYSLVGCTVGPGFEYADFQFVSTLPGHAEHFKGDLAPFADLL